MIKIELPEKVKFIIDTIENAGFEAFAVGGCVRDSILKRAPADWDITTSARPEQIKALFRRTIDTGIEHGTVTVMLKNEGFEVTTYRIDGEYEDSRHPKEVTFTPVLREDLARRDFTINALAYNDRVGIVDEFDGLGDLEKGIVRAVGVAEERFGEDALRILRAFRFAAQLDFEVEEKTAAAAASLAQTLEKISAERINTELTKLLASDHPDDILKLYEAGITKVILPEFDECMATEQNTPHHCYNVGLHTAKALANFRSDMASSKNELRVMRFALLLHDFGKPSAKTTDENGRDHFKGHALYSEKLAVKILRRLKSDNNTIDTVKRLVKYHDYRPECTEKSIRRAINKAGVDIFPMLIPMQHADISAQSDYKRDEKLERLDCMANIYRGIIERKECVTLKDLAVNGNDLIKAGMKPGREIGETLSWMLDRVLEEPSCNTKEILMGMLQEKI